MSNVQFPWMDQDIVKPRFDAHGDGWANAHRDCLGRGIHMNDLDAIMGILAFAKNTAEKLFLEYVPDDFENRLEAIRSFAYVALFDRKRSIDFALSDSNRVSLALYLHDCRVHATVQPVGPRFFFVIGTQYPPWTMHEINIENGQIIGNEILITTNTDKILWHRIWEEVGLIKLRNELKRWINHAT